MVIMFCGHAQFQKREGDEEKILHFLDEKIGKNSADIYLGDNGEFDRFAYDCCKKYKEINPNVSLLFVTPYMTMNYQRNQLECQKIRFDGIIYPEIEKKPKKFAIYYCNRWMVEKADFVVAYVKRDWGGAYTTYKYARRKGKSIFNLADGTFIV